MTTKLTLIPHPASSDFIQVFTEEGAPETIIFIDSFDKPLQDMLRNEESVTVWLVPEDVATALEKAILECDKEKEKESHRSLIKFWEFRKEALEEALGLLS